MNELDLPSGARMPKYGMGTWHMGERGAALAQESAAIRAGLDAGVRLIDTAEMYANGGAEKVIAAALQGRRDEVFIISKVLPSNASRAGVRKACEGSLQRLGTDRIDLYLLHWPGNTPIPKSSSVERTRENAGCIAIELSEGDRSELQADFPLPASAGYLPMR